MSMGRQLNSETGGAEPERSGEYVRVPAVIDREGDKVIVLIDDQGRQQVRLVAELVLEAFVGPRPPGHVVRFKDGDRLHRALENLEWVPTQATGLLERAGMIRKALDGRIHFDSGVLQAEDRDR